MIRSSTTALAKTCAALLAERRWMVSGTPLHSSINDLNGELQFLSVWPFSLSDHQVQA
jgi:E3 ubiquitin-protein ligase SHPRH